MKKCIILFMCAILLLTGCDKNAEKANVDTDSIVSEKVNEETTESITETELEENEEVATTKQTSKKETVSTTSAKENKNTKSSTKTIKSETDKSSTETKISSTTKSTTATTKKTTTTTTTEKPKTVAEVKASMLSLKNKYPNGTVWNNSNYYAWKGGIYSGGYGCAGFAFMLSDAAFGSKKAKMHKDFNNIKVGDAVRYLDDTHYVMVLEVNGDTFTVAEGNMNGTVLWGRKITRDEFKASGTHVITRW